MASSKTLSESEIRQLRSNVGKMTEARLRAELTKYQSVLSAEELTCLTIEELREQLIALRSQALSTTALKMPVDSFNPSANRGSVSSLSNVNPMEGDLFQSHSDDTNTFSSTRVKESGSVEMNAMMTMMMQFMKQQSALIEKLSSDHVAVERARLDQAVLVEQSRREDARMRYDQKSSVSHR